MTHVDVLVLLSLPIFLPDLTVYLYYKKQDLLTLREQDKKQKQIKLIGNIAKHHIPTIRKKMVFVRFSSFI